MKIHFCTCLFAISGTLSQLFAAPGDANENIVNSLNELLTNVQPYSSNKTSYVHRDPLTQDVVAWNGDDSYCHTDCSGLLVAVLHHLYPAIDQTFYAEWMNTTRPRASDFHDAISMAVGFDNITDVSALRAGDIIAVKYGKNNPIDTDDTGHIMILAEAPRKLATPLPPTSFESCPGRFDQWEVAIIDESNTGHGTGDTRYTRTPITINGKETNYHQGIGKGTIRLYTDSDNRLKVLTWSTAANTTPFCQGSPVNPADFNIVFGRFDPGFTPGSTIVRLTVQDSGPGTGISYPLKSNYLEGSTAMLYQSAHSGSTFVGWEGGVIGTMHPAPLLMNGDKSVTARFAPAIWADWDASVDVWLGYNWFGYIYLPGGSWLYHQELGWMASSGTSADSFYLYQESLGWLWTSQDSFPFLYQTSTSDWIVYIGSNDNRAFFTNQNTGETFSITPQS